MIPVEMIQHIQTEMHYHITDWRITSDHHVYVIVKAPDESVCAYEVPITLADYVNVNNVDEIIDIFIPLNRKQANEIFGENWCR